LYERPPVEAHCRRKENVSMSDDEMRHCEGLMGIIRKEFGSQKVTAH